MQVINRYVSSDGAVKRVHQLDDGLLIESVLIPHSTKINLCISTQAGCRQACSFCATGKYFKRNLTSQEILDQIDEPVDSLVFMGMGEPLDNPNTMEAIARIIKEKGIAPRKIVVSTSGLLDKVDQLLPTKVNIAFSVHATTEEQRMKLMPINRRFPLSKLSEKMFEIDSKLPSKRRLEAQYIMIKDFNDSVEDAKRLSQLIPKKTLINLIPAHPTGSIHLPSEKETILAFKEELRKAGFICYVRESRGLDIQAACGMLTGQTSTKL